MKKIYLPACILMLSFTSLFSISASAESSAASDIMTEVSSSVMARLKELGEKNSELSDFAAGYEEKIGKDFPIDLSEEAKSDEVPLLIQWDERWGYHEYGSGLIGYTGCGPTCLSMLALYFTDNEEYTPLYTAKYAMDKGYYVWGAGTAWELFESGCKDFGMRSDNISISADNIRKRLDDGEILVASMRPGDFTTGGHFLIIRGYDEEGFYVNDPNSKKKSKKVWAADVIVPQIKQLWSFRKK